MAVYSCYQGDNGVLIASVAQLYLKAKQRICDPTYGKGVFWRDIDSSTYELYASDLVTVPNRKWDFRKLPYPDHSFDHFVFDPPYAHNPGTLLVDPNYKNAATTRGFYHRDIMDLYRDGLRVAKRLLKPEGLCWVKCQDEIESSLQRWSHIEIFEMARAEGFFGKDFFVLVQSKRPVVQHAQQQHARKAHSYLWIFKVPSQQEVKLLKRHKIWPA